MTPDVNPAIVGENCNIVNSELSGSLGTGVKSETIDDLQGGDRKVEKGGVRQQNSREGKITADPGSHIWLTIFRQ